MKKNYVKPQITIRNTRIKNYVICATGNTGNTGYRTREMTWDAQLSKDRNDDIWNSDDDGASIW